jgi:hypothetical protein
MTEVYTLWGIMDLSANIGSEWTLIEGWGYFWL